MDQPDLQHESVNELFDGNTISPQFAVALKQFLQNNKSQAKSGRITIPGSRTHYAIPHGLPGTPTLISISPYFYPTGGGGVQVSSNTPYADETNIYVDNGNAVYKISIGRPQ